MTRKLGNNLDADRYQLLNLVLERRNSAPSSPVEAQVYYSDPDHTAYYFNGTSWVPFSGGGGGGGSSLLVLPYNVPGILSVADGTTKLYNDSGGALTIVSVRIGVTTSPTGASIIVDMNKNGTSIFTTQSNRPAITPGGSTSGKVTNMDITSLADGDYMTVDVNQVGSTIPGAGLTAEIWLAA